MAWQRSYIAGIDSFDPAALRDASHVEAGLLVNQWKMFVAMCHEWSPLAKDLETITGAVAALDWTVTPATLEGEEPTPLAQEVAKTVQAAIWARGEREQGTWSHDFLDLVRGVCHAIYRGHNVHEIIWTRNDRMVFPQEYKPVPPLFYAWSPQGRDRLELCPKGYGMGPGVPFPPDKFIVALNNCGPDHPTQNAVLNALVGWFGASKWGLSWFLQYCQVAGLPIKKFKCQNDSDRKKLQAAVKENPILSEVFVTEPNDLEIIQAAASGASIPQAVVLDMAERACHKLILGNTLTSDTTKDGGSRAQAEVHQEVQNEAVLALGNFVSNILNAQLVPALVRKNYGRTEGLPLPEIRCTVPSAGVNMDRLEFYCKFINELGCPVSRSKLYDDCGVPIPADGDDVVGPVAKPGVEDPLSAAAAARYGADTASRVERRAQAAEDAAEAVAARWMAPVLRSVAELVRSGGSPADVKKKLETLEPDTAALAASLEDVTKGSLGVGQAVQVGAENPYGCNQYGEGWAHPHNGNSTAYRDMSPFGNAPKKKVLTNEADGNTVEEVTDKREPGKGAYPDARNENLAKEAADAKAEDAKRKEAAAKRKEAAAKRKAKKEAEAKAKEERAKKEAAWKKAEDEVTETSKQLGKVSVNARPSTVAKVTRQMHEKVAAAELARRELVGDDAWFNPKPEDVIPEKLVKQIAATPSLLNNAAKKEVAEEMERRQPIMKIDMKYLLGHDVTERGKTRHVMGILEDSNERVLNFCEAGSYDGDYYNGRLNSESRLEGTDKNDIDGRNHPICSLLERSVGGAIHNFNTGSYGNIFVEFKPEVRKRTTFTGLNSLDSDLYYGVKVSSMLTKPNEGQPWGSEQVRLLNGGAKLNDIVTGKHGGARYMEAQIRGNVTAMNINSIGVPKKQATGGWMSRQQYKTDAKDDAEKIAEALSKVTGRKAGVKDAGNHWLVYFL